MNKMTMNKGLNFMKLQRVLGHESHIAGLYCKSFFLNSHFSLAYMAAILNLKTGCHNRVSSKGHTKSDSSNKF